jgi:glycosyltransferase involved in cell wall biosynthesis
MLRNRPVIRQVTPPDRVLMTLDSVGGVWRYAVDAARGLARRGTECLLVGLGPKPDAAASAEVAAIGGVRLAWLEAPLDWLAPEEHVLGRIGPELEDLALERGCSLMHLNAPSQAVGLRGCLPVVVASHSCVVTWWQAMRDEPLPPVWRWQRARNALGLSAADAVMAPSHSHAAALRAAYCIPGRIEVVHNASSPRLAADERQPMALAAGRWWDAAKNAEVLDAAAALVPFPVVLAGALEGPDGSSFEPRHAVAAGLLEPSQLRASMERAAIFVAPSRYEPFGLAVLEAAGTGAALVLADIPTFRELWHDAAIFCPADDAAAFAAAMQQVIGDPALRDELGAVAFARAQSFTADRQTERLLAVYARFLDGAATTPASAEAS